jgi:mono/diheme cytochrome c family protein
VNPKLSHWLLITSVATAPCAWAVITPEQLAQLPPPAAHTINFSAEIKPIFEASCIKCHGRGRDKGDFRIDTRETLLKGGESGAAIVPGKSAESRLINLVMGFDPDDVMPKKGTRLTREQIAALRAWIDQGAQWDASVTFAKVEPANLKPRRPEFPTGRPKDANPVDRFLEPYFAAHNIKPAKGVDDRLFARRVWLDVLGLLPPPEELERFVTDKNRDKRARLVRRLLTDNENYALHWMSFWNDMLRNDYRGTGYIDGGRKQITQWLFTALEANKPYNQFVAELVNPTSASEGFAKGIIWRGVVNASQTPQMQAAQNVSQVFMGVNLKCASCHDSFVNDWTLADAYGLAGVYADGPLEMVHCDRPTGKIAAAKFIYPQLGEIGASTNRADRLAQLAQIITRREDGRLTRTLVNRLWQRFFGRGLVEPLDDMDKPAWNPDLLDALAEDFADHDYDVKRLIEILLTSRAYALPAVPATERADAVFVFRGPEVRRLSAEQFRDAVGALADVWPEKPNAQIVRGDGSTNRFARTRAALVAAESLQVALGRPNREQVVTSRATAATTLQALELTNGSELAGLLKRGAEKILAGEKEITAGPVVARVYEAALGRAPTQREMEMASSVVGQPVQPAGLEDLLWSLTMLPEFQLIY